MISGTTLNPLLAFTQCASTSSFKFIEFVDLDAAMPPSYRARNPWLRGLIALFVLDTVAAACYYPNGTDRNAEFPTDIFYPINPEDDFSMCCSNNGDQPRIDGLCLNRLGTIIWRESCTDRTWTSPKCIKLCAGTSTGMLLSSWLQGYENLTNAEDRYPQCPRNRPPNGQ